MKINDKNSYKTRLKHKLSAHFSKFLNLPTLMIYRMHSKSYSSNLRKIHFTFGKCQAVYHIEILLNRFVIWVDPGTTIVFEVAEQNISMLVIIKISYTLDVMIENEAFVIDSFCIWINEM